MRLPSRAVGLLLGYTADRLLGDPRRLHPVAGFGLVAGRLEQRMYADRRRRGAAYTLTLVGGAALAGVPVERARHRPLIHALGTALATWAVLGGRSLDREAEAIRALLAAGDLTGARSRLPHLVGRDPRLLDELEIARAVVESVAENTSDAVVAPLLWGAVAGVPGLLGYRAANTLDAMVGHRNARYRRFGWAAARLDDLLNLPAARLAGALTAVVAPRRAGAVVRLWRRDAAGHPSPNAGVIEAAFAGALDLTLGGTNVYGGRVEHRAPMGEGAAPTAEDIRRSGRLAGRLGLAAAGVAVGVAVGAAALVASRPVSHIAAGSPSK